MLNKASTDVDEKTVREYIRYPEEVDQLREEEFKLSLISLSNKNQNLILTSSWYEILFREPDR